MSGCPHDIPAIQVSTGNSGELDLITPSYGFIRYDTTHHNLEVYEENGWKDIVINDKTNIDISGKIIVNDVSINSNLLAVDASFSNIGGIDGSLIVLGDLSVTGNIYTSAGILLAQITNLQNQITTLQTQIGNIVSFDRTANISFTGNNTFTGTNAFNNTSTKIEGQVVQIKSFHSRQANLSNSNGHTGTTGENYTLMGASPVDFKCSITPSNTNCYIRVSVVAHYSINPFMLNGQGSWWSGVRLYRTKGDGVSSGLTELKHANNTRGGNPNTATSIGDCWITETAGASNLGGNTWNSNFIRQVSGIYIDKDVKVGLGGAVEYSIAIRGNTTQTTLNGNQMAVAFNQGYQGIGSGRPASTSYIQLEEIYKPE